MRTKSFLGLAWWALGASVLALPTTEATWANDSIAAPPSPHRERRLADVTCTLEKGVDFAGNDIGHALAPTANDCCGICGDRAGCGAFTWTNYNGGTCWLKSTRGTKTTNSGAISAVVGTSTIGGGSCTIETGIDIVGNDIGAATAATAQDCCAKCSQRSGCGAFTWTNYNGGTCWLKSKRGATTLNVGALSGVITTGGTTCSSVEQNVDYKGNDIGSVSGTGAADCCTKCSQRSGCGAFTWSSYNGGTCWLKSSRGQTSSASGLVSGTVPTTTPRPSPTTTPSPSPTPMAHIQPKLRSGEVRAKSVNLGGWLVAEYWMSMTSPAWGSTDGSGWGGEYVAMKDLENKIGRDRAIAQFEQHRQTWITEADIREIAAAGLNSVRVPVGFWIVNDDPSTTATAASRVYAPGSLKYLDRLINDWAVKYNVAVMLSLHAHQGSQNGYDHSAPQLHGTTAWSTSQANVDNSLQFATYLAARYKNSIAFLGMNLMNEPSFPTDYNVLWNYYKEAYRRIRATGNNCILGTSPMLQEQGPPVMMDFMRWPEYDNVWHEFHVYYKWGWEGRSEAEILAAAKTYRATHLDNWTGNWIYMGEWSLAAPDDRFTTAASLKEYAQIQLQQYAGARAGFAFWSWHHDDEKTKLSGWSLRQLLREGILTIPA